MTQAGIPAHQLLQQFSVYGRFYTQAICGVHEQLRDRLEIAPHNWTLDQVLAHAPDLLVVMMNPGASRPLGALWDAGAAHGFTAAQPDRTQYQIMRLLLAAQQYGLPWLHARVLNLSDLRTPKSALLLEKTIAYQADDRHSIFSTQRKAECQRHFVDTATPVLCGWGLNPQLNALAVAALQAAQGHPLLGITTDGILYRHPLPQRHDLQIQWLQQIQSQIQAMRTAKLQ